MDLGKLRVKIYCDSADLSQMREMTAAGLVCGYTSNPSLAKKAGVANYLDFCREAAAEFPHMPLSLEVLADEPDGIRRQVRLLASLGTNIFVKIPVVRTTGESNAGLIRELSQAGIHINVTAIFTHKQIATVCEALDGGAAGYVSVFAGRIADAGQCPLPYVQHAIHETEGTPHQVIWASVREPYNVLQAGAVGCDIITVFPPFLLKLKLFGKPLDEFSRETVQMFMADAASSGFTL